MNIKNTLELVALGASLGQAFSSAQEDGTINALDLGHLIAVIPHVSPALSNISDVPAELNDLDSSEIEEIKAQVIDIVGDVSSDKAVEIAEASIALVFNVWDLIQAIRSTSNATA